tara:strand:- start:1190 stop:1639 length:450 start_codon:yes stop_codon:yes gene_type:complete
MTHTVSIIPRSVLNVVQGDAMRLLEPAVDRSDGRHNISTVWAAIEEGHYALWLAFDANNTPVGSLVTRLEEYPLKNMLNLLFCGGAELEEWHEAMLDTLEVYAKEHKCDGMELIGRPGWKPFLKKHGWGSGHLVVERTFEIEEEQKEVA